LEEAARFRREELERFQSGTTVLKQPLYWQHECEELPNGVYTMCYHESMSDWVFYWDRFKKQDNEYFLFDYDTGEYSLISIINFYCKFNIRDKATYQPPGRYDLGWIDPRTIYTGEV
jgi:hypothetical protein